MRLCWQMGEMDVEDALERISSERLAEWIAFMNLEPSGGLQEDLRAGLLAASIYNANPFRGSDAPYLTPEVFFPNLKKMPVLEKPAESPAEASERFRLSTLPSRKE